MKHNVRSKYNLKDVGVGLTGCPLKKMEGVQAASRLSEEKKTLYMQLERQLFTPVFILIFLALFDVAPL